jgi:LysM repeat protein
MNLPLQQRYKNGVSWGITICLGLMISLVLGFPHPAISSPYPYGVDSVTPVDNGLISEATNFLGETPSVWGRYFEGPFAGTCTDRQSFTSYEYTSQENEILGSSGIHLIPVALSTQDVGGSNACGAEDGKVQAQSFLSALGEDYLASQGGEYYVFLDVELGAGNPVLNPSYYLGWSQAIENASTANVKLLPGVYMSVANTTSAQQLNSAISGGAKCSGLWIAGYRYGEGWQGSLPPWNQNLEATPEVDINCPVLLWQFAQNVERDFDLDMVNPASAATTLKNLVIPPSANATASKTANSPASSPTGVASNGTCPYTIQPGNTLSGLAQQYLGSSSKWPEITHTNGQPFTEAEADNLEVGEVVVIPTDNC